MKSIYITYVITINEIEKVRNDLEKILEIFFEGYESSYLGVYFEGSLSETEKIKISFNYLDEDWSEEDYKDFPILIELICSQNPHELIKLISDSISYAIPIRKCEIVPNEYIYKYIFEDGHL